MQRGIARGRVISTIRRSCSLESSHYLIFAQHRPVSKSRRKATSRIDMAYFLILERSLQLILYISII